LEVDWEIEYRDRTKETILITIVLVITSIDPLPKLSSTIIKDYK